MISLLIALVFVAIVYIVRHFLMKEPEEKTGVYQEITTDSGQVQLWNVTNKISPRTGFTRPAYDPSLDEDKLLKGEVESYFD